jgi:hypothetical protein
MSTTCSPDCINNFCRWNTVRRGHLGNSEVGSQRNMVSSDLELCSVLGCSERGNEPSGLEKYLSDCQLILNVSSYGNVSASSSWNVADHVAPSIRTSWH